MGLLNDGLLHARLANTRARLAGLDIASLSAMSSDKTPEQMASISDQEKRRAFIHRSVGDPDTAEKVFERIIGGNEIQDIAYLERGMIAARAVCRVVIGGRQGNYGTGFLIAPGVLLTNNHVLPDSGLAARSRVEFNYERDRFGNPLDPVEYRLNPDLLFHTSKELDFSVVAVRHRPEAPLSRFGYCPLVVDAGKAIEGEWLTIVQHPGGERKQVCVRENRLIHRDADVLWYTTDTLPGTSGAPVYNNDWLVVALHHSGVPEERDGVIQTIHGRPYVPGQDGENDIKWIANEGIRASCIVKALRDARPDDPLLLPVFEARAENIVETFAHLRTTTTPAAHKASIPTEKEQPMSLMPVRSVSVTLDIADDGSVRLRGTAPHVEAIRSGDGMVRPQAKPEARPLEIDVPFDATYKSREGFLPQFLVDSAHPVDGLHTPLPIVTDTSIAAPLLPPSHGHILKYHGMSVVMHKERRFAIYSAANVDFANRFDMGRPPDRWLTDPRISAQHQIGAFYYRSNKFDRGHLTRREDMEYGQAGLSPKDSRIKALEYAADTCHYPNCVPQHSQFNQNKQLWQGLERHLLEEAIKADNFRAQIFTGPVLEEDDPVYERFPDIQYPVRFWKIAVATVGSGEDARLFAAGFILDQSEVVAQYGIEATIPFEPYKTFQVKIREIEALTGLIFPAGKDGKTDNGAEDFLRNYDPLEQAKGGAEAKRRGQRRVRQLEATGSAPSTVPAGYVALDQLQDVVV